MTTPSPPTAPLQERSQRSLERILEATERLLESRPFSAITVSEIAREAGVSTGLLYSRFDSKDDILPYLVERFLREQDEAFREALPEGEARPLRDRLDRLAGRVRGMADASLGLLRAAAARRLLRPEEIGEDERRRTERIRDVGRTWLSEAECDVARDDPRSALEFAVWTIFLVGQIGPMLVRDERAMDGILENLGTALELFLESAGPTARITPRGAS